MSLDEARLLAFAFRRRLFQAIDERDFRGIPALGRDYCTQIRYAIQTSPVPESRDLQPVLRAPLLEGIRYLRAVRAHQSVAFRKLARDKVYSHNGEPTIARSTLRVSA
jgi:hypothetical protein